MRRKWLKTGIVPRKKQDTVNFSDILKRNEWTTRREVVKSQRNTPTQVEDTYTNTQYYTNNCPVESARSRDGQIYWKFMLSCLCYLKKWKGNQIELLEKRQIANHILVSSKQMRQSKVTRTNQWPIANRHQTTIQPITLAIAIDRSISIAVRTPNTCS